MSDKVYIGKKAKDIKASPSFLGYTKVVIIVGEDENGNQRVYEAGTDTGNVLEVTNPWGTQQMANDMLARIQGYAYKPISADGAILTPAAELGDGVTAGTEYSVLASQNVHFDTLHASDIEAPDNGELEHEMPEYLSAADRKVARRFNTITTSFTVKLGEIETEITDTANGLSTRITQNTNSITSEVTRATQAEGDLSSRITQTVDTITSEVTRAKNAEGTLSSRITQTAESITSEVTRATAAEGALSSRITQTADSITSEVTRATLAEGELSSKISQTAADILLSVKGDYAPEWSSGKTYYVDDVVKVTTYSNDKVSAVNFYKCMTQHTSSNSNKPPNSTYWTAVSAPTVQSMIDMNLDGISISYSNSAANNSSYVKLMKNGVEIGGGTVTMGTVVADSVQANWVYAGNIKAKQIDISHGLIQASQIATSQLVVGTNISMGDNATISWSKVDDKPTDLAYTDDIPTTSDITTITENTIKTTNVVASNLKVSAANVTGTLTIGQLPSTVAEKTDIPKKTSELTNDSKFVNSTAVTTITNNTISTTNVVAQNLQVKAANITGTLFAASLSLNGLLEIRPEGGTLYGYVGGATGLQSGVGAVLASSSLNSFVITTNSAAQLRYTGNDHRIWVADGGCYSNENMQTYSDKRAKHDIDYDLSRYDAFFASLRPCAFVLDSDKSEKTRTGFIAQDILEALEASGMGKQDFAGLGYYAEDDRYTLSYTEFIALCVRQIQQLQSKIKELESKWTS